MKTFQLGDHNSFKDFQSIEDYYYKFQSFELYKKIPSDIEIGTQTGLKFNGTDNFSIWNRIPFSLIHKLQPLFNMNNTNIYIIL